jgi:hypothetical protein
VGRVEVGDLVINQYGRLWAKDLIGACIYAVGVAGVRIYRKMPVAQHLNSQPLEAFEDPRTPASVMLDPGLASYERSLASGLKDSGARREFTTGAVRDVAEGKGRFDLLPYRALTLAAQQMERGAIKYSARNWEKGIPLGEFFNSGLRHLWKWWLGYKDEPHLAAFVWNALCMAETAERIRLGILPKDLDNRPDVGTATPEEQGI